MAEGEKSADAADFFLALGEQSSTVAIAPAAAAGADEAAAAAASAAADARLFRVRAAPCCIWCRPALMMVPCSNLSRASLLSGRQMPCEILNKVFSARSSHGMLGVAMLGMCT